MRDKGIARLMSALARLSQRTLVLSLLSGSHYHSYVDHDILLALVTERSTVKRR